MSTSAAKKADAEERQRIEDARRILRPTEVDLGKSPKWLRPLIAAFRRKHELDALPVSMALENTIGEICQDVFWLDHWGQAKGSFQCCQSVEYSLIAEPYNFEPGTVESLNIFCKKLGLTWHVSSNSWWYPGSTVRIEIHPKGKGDD